MLAAEIKARARALGFEAVGITTPDAIPHAAARLRAFLRAGRHGDMGWLAERAAARGDPRTLWPAVRAIVMVGQNYAPDADPLAGLRARDRGLISAYAQGRDYHDVLKSKLKALARAVAAESGAEVKVFVDTAPVLEKPLAAAAGVGWQGKHTNLVSRRFGSWLFLGALFTTLPLAADRPEADHCGTCRACLEICPTSAFPGPYELDARRCLSYLSIEAKGQIPRAFRRAMGNRIYGCDDCLAVCPWNKFAETAAEMRLRPRADLHLPPLAELARLDDAGFRARFAGTAVKRLGRTRFVRNVLVAVGNSGDPSLRPCAEELLGDAAALVRGMAVWALAQLLPEAAFAALRARSEPGEDDAAVREEWAAGRG